MKTLTLPFFLGSFIPVVFFFFFSFIPIVFYSLFDSSSNQKQFFSDVFFFFFSAGKRERYRTDLGLSEADAAALSDDQAVALYFEEAVAAGSDPGEACKWLIGDIAGYLNR